MTELRLGLRENLPQFTLLVFLNAFVGAMVGLERTVLPLLGEQEFGLSSKTAITSFIVSFGVTKAIVNLVAARISDRIGRKPVLVTGWLFALPVPFLIIFAQAWWWIDLANVLLGANQALAWSMTVIMKIDLVGPKRRGLALGLNEFAGYFAVGVTSWVTGYLGAQYDPVFAVCAEHAGNEEHLFGLRRATGGVQVTASSTRASYRGRAVDDRDPREAEGA